MEALPTRTWNGLTIPAPGTWTLDQNHKRLGFLAMHMMVSPVRGEFADGEAVVEVGEDPLASRVSCTIRADSITTHVDDRDTHLKSPDFLDVENHPTIEFRSTGLRLQAEADPIFSWARLKAGTVGRRPHDPRQADGAFTKFLMDGLLTVRGMTRPVTLDCDFGGVGRDPYGQDIFGFHGSCEIDREEWGLLWNVALETGGVLVARKVRIEIAGEMVRQA